MTGRKSSGEPLGPRFMRGFSTMGQPELDLEQHCLLARKYGLDFLELRSLANTLDLPQYFSGEPGRLEAALDALRNAGVRVLVVSSSFQLSDAGEDDDALFSDYCRLADALNSPYIRVFGGDADGASLERAIATTERWQALRVKHRYRCEMLLETHGAFSESTACLKLNRALSRKIPILWDSHHTWKIGGECPNETWHRLKSSIHHIHCKDSVSIPSDRHNYSYVLPGEGEYPWCELLDAINRDGYRQGFSLEWEKQWHPDLPSLDRALVAWSNYLSELSA